MPKKTTQNRPQTGPIRPECLYPRNDLMDRLGVRHEAMREMEQRGLRSYRIGNRKYYLGENVISFILSSARQETGQPG